MTTGRRMVCTVPGLAGHPSLDATPSRSQRRAGSRHLLPCTSQPLPHPLQVELSAFPPHASMSALPRTEHRGFPTRCLPSSGHSQIWGKGGFCRFGEGGHSKRTLTIKIGSQPALRWDDLFSCEDSLPHLSPIQQVCWLLFCPLLHCSLPGNIVEGAKY